MKPTPTPTPTPNATPLTRAFGQDAANPPWKLPPPLFDARCRACWFTAALLLLVVASFVSLNLDWAAFASMDAALRAIPELVWAALLLISAGLGPMAGTLALALHTSGVLGRLFAEAMENVNSGPGDALRTQGVGPLRVFAYATLPQVLPQLMSYMLYRWENNIRAAAVLGVVGAGGLGQLLSFHMGLFQMNKTATILAAMLLMVGCVDALSFSVRRWLNR